MLQYLEKSKSYKEPEIAVEALYLFISFSLVLGTGNKDITVKESLREGF